MTNDELKTLLSERPTVPLWPVTGKALGLGRGATYSAASKGDIETIQIGKKKPVPSLVQAPSENLIHRRWFG